MRAEPAARLSHPLDLRGLAPPGACGPLCYDWRPIHGRFPLSSIDLHSHSDCSDGALAPAALIERAAGRGVRTLALTDHDTVEGLDEAQRAARECAIELVTGVEISVTWSGRTLHVVGLNVDPANLALQRGLESVRAGRLQRAESIGQRLAALGFRSALEGAVALASNPDLDGRLHFARHLVAAGIATDIKSAFRRFLGEGKPAYVRHRWADLVQAIGWIRQAGGIAVLAHPLRYGLSAPRLRELIEAFRAAGGSAIEVLTAGCSDDQARLLARAAADSGLVASAGSDFHSPEESWFDLGQFGPLPAGCEPIWARWPGQGRIAYG